MEPHISVITIGVADLEKSLAFYRDGLGLLSPNVLDFDQFLRAFSNEGVGKRREYVCKGAHVIRDPDDANRVWAFFEWAQKDFEEFLADPDIPAIGRKLALQGAPVKVEPIAQYDT